MSKSAAVRELLDHHPIASSTTRRAACATRAEAAPGDLFRRMSERWTATVDPPWDFDAWREQARAALRAAPPAGSDRLARRCAGCVARGRDILSAPAVRALPSCRAISSTSAAARGLSIATPDAHALLYRMAWRIAQWRAPLCTLATDVDTHRALRLIRPCVATCTR
jgi:hypothetical protein